MAPLRSTAALAAALAASMIAAACSEQPATTAPESAKTAAAAPKPGADPAAVATCGLVPVDYDFRGLKDRFLVGKGAENSLNRQAVLARRVIHVNTDGAPNSYHSKVIGADDRQLGALNLICNAVVAIHPESWFAWLPWVAKPKPLRCYGERGIRVDPGYAAIYEKIRANDWKPTDGHRIKFNWDILGKQPGGTGWWARMFETEKPCVNAQGFFTSMTKLVRARPKDGCDQSAYIDANEVPAFVLPKHWFDGWSSSTTGRWASFKDGDVMVAHRPASGERPESWVYGIVGDAGPIGKLGEASIAMNWALKGEEGQIREKVRSYADVLKLDSGTMSPKEIPFLVLEGTASALGGNFGADHVRSVAEKSFEAWGGPIRFKACLAAL